MFARKQKMMTTRIIVVLSCCTLVCYPGLTDVFAGSESAIVLRERGEEAACTQVRIELKAEGLFRPGLPAGSIGAEVRMPKPLALDVKTRLVFIERLIEDKGPDRKRERAERLETRARSSKRKAIRWVSQAAAAINGEVRPMSSLASSRAFAAGGPARGRPRGRRRGEPGRTPDPVRARARGGARVILSTWPTSCRPRKSPRAAPGSSPPRRRTHCRVMTS